MGTNSRSFTQYWMGLLFFALFLVFGAAGLALAADIYEVRPGSSVNARSGPGTSNEVVGKLESGAKMEALEKRDGWMRFEISPGQEAWGAERLVEAADGSTQALPTEAKSVHGITVNARINDIRGAAFSQDASLLALAGQKVQIWDVREMRLLRDIPVEDFAEHPLFLDGGRILQTFVGGAHIVRYEVATGRKIGTASPSIQSFSGFNGKRDFRSDGLRAVWVDDQGEVDFIDAATGRRLRDPFPRRTDVSSIAFVGLADRVAIGTTAGTVEVWDAANRRQVAKFTVGASSVTSLSADPRGDIIFAATEKEGVTAWDVTSVRAAGRDVVNVTSLGITADGSTVLMTGMTGSGGTWRWNWQDAGSPISVSPKSYDDLFSSFAVLSPNGTHAFVRDFGPAEAAESGLLFHLTAGTGGDSAVVTCDNEAKVRSDATCLPDIICVVANFSTHDNRRLQSFDYWSIREGQLIKTLRPR